MSNVDRIGAIIGNNRIVTCLTAAGIACLFAMSIHPISASESSMSQVEKLVAIEDIKQVKARYFRCADTKDWECWRTRVFAPGYTIRGRPSGADAMIDAARLTGMYDRVRTVHTGHMPEIEILSPTTARGVWRADFFHYYPPDQSYETTGKESVEVGEFRHTSAMYFETYVKINGAWFIKSTDIKNLMTDGSKGVSVPETIEKLPW